MTLNDRDACTTLGYTAFSWARCVEVNEDRRIILAAKDSPGVL